jgi:hypothetical protein
VLDQFDGLDRRGRGHADLRTVGRAGMSDVIGPACICPLTEPQGLFALGVTPRPVARDGGAGPRSAA